MVHRLRVGRRDYFRIQGLPAYDKGIYGLFAVLEYDAHTGRTHADDPAGQGAEIKDIQPGAIANAQMGMDFNEGAAGGNIMYPAGNNNAPRLQAGLKRNFVALVAALVAALVGKVFVHVQS
jgi:hypothetical protein